MVPRAVVFDAYGTLLDVHAAMQRNAAALPPYWERISGEWRTKQLEYTWIRTLTGPHHHRNFWALTEAALDYVLARHRLADPALRAALLETYRELPAFPDAKPALATLRARGIRTAILSNGERKMLGAAVAAAGLSDLLDAVISIDPIRTFKPAAAVYVLAEQALTLPARDMAFVSSNAWDAQAALANGYATFWCNRVGNPVEYGLGQSATIVGGLDEVAAALTRDDAA